MREQNRVFDTAEPIFFIAPLESAHREMNTREIRAQMANFAEIRGTNVQWHCVPSAITRIMYTRHIILVIYY